MSQFPYFYVSSAGGQIGNIRWLNSDTRWPDCYPSRYIDREFRSGYWGWTQLITANVDADGEVLS